MINQENIREELRRAQNLLEERVKLEQEFEDAKAVLKKLLPGRRIIEKKEEKWSRTSKEPDVYRELACCLDKSNRDTTYFEILTRERSDFGGWVDYSSLYRTEGKREIALMSSASGGQYSGQKHIFIEKSFWTLEGL